MTVEADTDHELTAAMHQQVRQLTLVIEPTGDAADRIESIEGCLSGAAGTLDFATGTYGAASDVALHFTKITEGSDAGKWTATVRLLGITGNTQTLTVTTLTSVFQCTVDIPCRTEVWEKSYICATVKICTK